MSQCNQVPTREEEEGGGVGQTINTLVPPPPPLRHPTKRNAHTHARTRRRRHMPCHPGHILHTYKRAVRHVLPFSPPRSSPFSHVLLCRAELFHCHSAQRDQELQCPVYVAQYSYSKCVCSHARPAGPTLSFSPLQKWPAAHSLMV